MPSIRIRAFGGMLPAVHDRAIDNFKSSFAFNTELRDGTLESYRKPLEVEMYDHIGSEPQAEAKGIYRLFDTQKCCTGAVTFDCYSSVIEPPTPSMCSGFESVVVFQCNCDCPQPYRYFPCSKKTYALVVPKPDKTLRLNRVVGSSVISAHPYAGPDERSYTYTWVDQFGVESPPSYPTAPVYSHDDEHWQISNFADPPANAVAARLYRTNSFFEGGENPDPTFATSFQLVTELELDIDINGLPENPGVFVDTRTLAEMEGGTLLTELDCPPPCLTQVVMTESGYAVGFDRNTIHVSERYEPHNWPERYRVEIPERIIAMVVFFDIVFVATTGRPYRLNIAFTAQGNVADATVDPSPFTENYPCLSMNTMVATPFGAMYATHRGLVALAPTGQARLITRRRIDEDDFVMWQPNIAVWHEGRYFAANSPVGKAFVVDIQEGGEEGLDFGDLVEIDWHPMAAHAGRDGRLYYVEGGKTLVWDEGHDLLPYIWRSKTYVSNGHTQFAAIKVVADYGPPVEVNVFADGRLYDTLLITSNKPRRFKFSGRGVSWVIEVKGVTRVSEVHLATSMTELTEQVA